MSSTHVSASKVIAADAQRLFDIVADPSMHPVIDGSGSVRGVRGGSRKLTLGEKFTTSMRLGVPYIISNRVVQYDEGRTIAWSHLGGWRWRYEFEPLADVDGRPRTRVTETFDWSTALSRRYIDLMGWPRRNQEGMERTLDRLDAYITNKASTL